MQSRFTGRSLVDLLARFTILYAIVLLLLWISPLARCISGSVVATTARLLPVFEATDTARTLTLRDNGSVRVRTKRSRIGYHLQPVWGNNLYVFVALVLASPGLSWRQRLTGITAGGALIILLNAVIMLGSIWEFERHQPRYSDLVPSGPFPILAAALARLSPTGGAYMLPVFLWGFALLGVGRGGKPRTGPASPA